MCAIGLLNRIICHQNTFLAKTGFMLNLSNFFECNISDTMAYLLPAAAVCLNTIVRFSSI